MADKQEEIAAIREKTTGERVGSAVKKGIIVGALGVGAGAAAAALLGPEAKDVAGEMGETIGNGIREGAASLNEMLLQNVDQAEAMARQGLEQGTIIINDGVPQYVDAAKAVPRDAAPTLDQIEAAAKDLREFSKNFAGNTNKAAQGLQTVTEKLFNSDVMQAALNPPVDPSSGITMKEGIVAGGALGGTAGAASGWAEKIRAERVDRSPNQLGA